MFTLSRKFEFDMQTKWNDLKKNEGKVKKKNVSKTVGVSVCTMYATERQNDFDFPFFSLSLNAFLLCDFVVGSSDGKTKLFV